MAGKKTRQERNLEAYELGFRGKKSGGVAGALDAQIEYRKTKEFHHAVRDMQQWSTEANAGFDRRTIERTAMAASNNRDVTDNLVGAYSRDLLLWQENNPGKPISQFNDEFKRVSKYFNKKTFNRIKQKQIPLSEYPGLIRYLKSLGRRAEFYSIWYH